MNAKNIVSIILLCSCAFAQTWTLIDSFFVPTVTGEIRGICFIGSKVYIADGTPSTPAIIGEYSIAGVSETLNVVDRDTVNGEHFWSLVNKDNKLYACGERPPWLFALEPFSMSTMDSLDLSDIVPWPYAIRGVDYYDGFWYIVKVLSTTSMRIVVLNSSFAPVDSSPVFNRDGRNALTGLFVDRTTGNIFVNAYSYPSLTNGASYCLSRASWATIAIYDTPQNILEDIEYSMGYFWMTQMWPPGTWLYKYDFVMAIDESPSAKPTTFSISAYPNPFNGNCRLMIDDCGLGIDAIEVFDINGRMVEPVTELVEVPGGAKFPSTGSGSGLHEYIWQPDASLASDVYLVCVSIGEKSVAKRVVYLK